MTSASALSTAATPRPVLLINTVFADTHLQQMAQSLPSLELVYMP